MLHLLTTAVLWLAGAPAVHAQETTTELMLRIGVQTQQSNGQFAGFAGDSGMDRFESYAWANETLCQLSASGREPATVPAVGWHFRGQVLKRTADEFLVEIEWTRLWDRGGRLANGPRGSMQITLRPNEQLTLDEVTPTTVGCQVVGARLGAAILPQVRSRRLVGGGGAGGRGGGGSSSATGARSGGFGTGSGGSLTGGGTAGAGGGSGATGASAGPRGGGTPAGASATDRFPTPDKLPFAVPSWETYRRGQFDAEVWLVHKLPSRSEEVQRLTFMFGRNATQFAFPPIEVTKDGEKGIVDIVGSLYIGSIKGQEKLIVHLDRTIKKKTTSMGGSFKPVDIPEGGEVLSFELPVTVASSDPSLQSHFDGHHFSVRVRVTERK